MGGFVNRVPRADKAVIDDNKISNYLLKPEAKHYKEFVDVGYSKDVPERLKQDLYNGLQVNGGAEFEPDEYGTRRYRVNMELGVSRRMLFRTAWQIKKGERNPRFITTHRIGGK